MAIVCWAYHGNRGTPEWRPLLNRNPLDIVLGVKRYPCIIICQHGVYLEDKMAGSN